MVGHSEDLRIKYASVMCHVPGAIPEAWTSAINMGFGFMELTFELCGVRYASETNIWRRASQIGMGIPRK